MLQFHRISLSDAQWIDPLLLDSGFLGSEYVFSNLFIYRDLYQIDVADFDGCLIVRTSRDGKTSYMFPAGPANAGTITAMLDDAQTRGCGFAMHGIPKQKADLLEQWFPGKFIITELRDNFDYIYDSQSLITLSGKKLHSKRNFVNRFKQEHDASAWRFEPIDKGNIDECWDMNVQWCVQSGCGQDPGKRDEFCAVRACFANYDALKLTGGLLRLDGRVIAFTFGRQHSRDMFIVHVEKAFADIEGAYPMINQQFVSHACTEYKYVNREDDVGQPGLRKAKLSYKPAILFEKYHAAQND